MKILLVEDDLRVAEPLAEALRDQNYVVEMAVDGEEGFALLEAYHYDLILLDVILPKLDGITLCQRLRHSGNQTLILMLTARDESSDQVQGLDAGADDYVVKPYDLNSLQARIRALLRRQNPTLPPVLEWERLQLDPSHCQVQYAEQLLNLTPKEYALLALLMRNPHRVLSRRYILESLWTFDTPGEETVKVHLRGVRAKLKAAGAPANLIETIYGLGYRLNPNV